MRIISGIFKGKKILEPTDIKTRPLKDLTKESIFNVIIHSKKFKIDLKNSEILDLFSGVGSFGIECLSRGAKRVTFVENYKKVLPILQRNLINLKSIENYMILNEDIYNEKLFSKFKKKFDFIFLDPPYKDEHLENIITNIKNHKILDKKGIIIIHRHKKSNDILPKDFKILEEKNYGISKIIFGNFLLN